WRHVLQRDRLHGLLMSHHLELVDKHVKDVADRRLVFGERILLLLVREQRSRQDHVIKMLNCVLLVGARDGNLDALSVSPIQHSPGCLNTGVLLERTTRLVRNLPPRLQAALAILINAKTESACGNNKSEYVNPGWSVRHDPLHS